ncbi:Anhydro-N-acetylmuramic acid kinase [Paraphoma chrysanthemicola]|nr:Anhydro-N-acetylmuramic acid kinase [Paraphoma chrysanthemicola]
MRRTDSAMDTSELSREPITQHEQLVKDELDLRVLGVRSGSGLNELNFALVRYRQGSPNTHLCVELLKHGEIAVPPAIRTPILNLLREAQSKPALLTRINAQIGQMFSGGIKTFCQNYDIGVSDIDIVGTYTPTLGRFYYPPAAKAEHHPLGWNTIINSDTGLTTVFDFAVIERAVVRARISPVAFVDRLYLRHPKRFRVCINIDELANISFVSPSSEDGLRATISRDCGPGSLLIDYAMRYCTSNDHGQDHEGRFSANGKVNQAIVDRFLDSHDYLRQSPPLNIAREMFGDHEAQRLVDECLFSSMTEADTVATITRITAQNILKQYRRLLDIFFPRGQKVDELFICGPSARNSNIIDYLEAELPESVITKPLDDIGIPGDANEAVCYAHLALETVLREATQSPKASIPTSRPPLDDDVRGRIVRGEKWEQLVGRVQRFSHGKPLHVTQDVRVTGDVTAGIERLGL